MIQLADANICSTPPPALTQLHAKQQSVALTNLPKCTHVFLASTSSNLLPCAKIQALAAPHETRVSYTLVHLLPFILSCESSYAQCLTQFDTHHYVLITLHACTLPSTMHVLCHQPCMHSTINHACTPPSTMHALYHKPCMHSTITHACTLP